MRKEKEKEKKKKGKGSFDDALRCTRLHARIANVACINNSCRVLATLIEREAIQQKRLFRWADCLANNGVEHRKKEKDADAVQCTCIRVCSLRA